MKFKDIDLSQHRDLIAELLEEIRDDNNDPSIQESDFSKIEWQKMIKESLEGQDYCVDQESRLL